MGEKKGVRQETTVIKKECKVSVGVETCVINLILEKYVRCICRLL